MMYPKKTPKQAKEEQEAKKLINQNQREQLKSMISQRLHAKYPNKDVDSVDGRVQEFFKGNQPLTAETLKKLDQNVQANTKEAQYIDRDDISVKSGVSKMSGATDFASVRGDDESGSKKENKVIDLMLATKKDNTGKKYKNEEEEWADIYKNNLQVYKAEADLEEDRKRFAKTKYKEELDEQVVKKALKKKDEIDDKQVDYQDVIKRVDNLEKKEKKKVEVAKAKMMYEKEMRDKQIKENKKQKRQEQKEEQQLDAYIIKRIQEEQLEDERVARQRKKEEYEGFRKIFQENEEKRKEQAEEQEKERQEENRLIDLQNRLIAEKERARDEEAKAKDKRVREQIEAGKNLLGKPSDERERRQDMKVQKWADRKEQEETEEEMRQKHLIQQRNLENKAYLDKQTAEKQIRKKEEKRDRDEQAGIWKNSTDQYQEWEKKKAEARKEEMKAYSDVLKKQMTEKAEERRVTDRLFDLRATQYEKKNQQQQQQQTKT